MQWFDSSADGYTPFRPDNDEIRAVNAYANTADAAGFLAWLQERRLRDRQALVCVLLAYGCEYNQILEPVDSFPEIVRPLVHHMTTWLGGDNGAVYLDQKFAFDYVECVSEDLFPQLAKWAFTFYARNDNWRRFPEAAP